MSPSPYATVHVASCSKRIYRLSHSSFKFQHEIFNLNEHFHGSVASERTDIEEFGPRCEAAASAAAGRQAGRAVGGSNGQSQAVCTLEKPSSVQSHCTVSAWSSLSSSAAEGCRRLCSVSVCVWEAEASTGRPVQLFDKHNCHGECRCRRLHGHLVSH